MRVGIIFGGQSSEHEVSVVSARCVLREIDREKFTPVLIGIDDKGKWRLVGESVQGDRVGDGEEIRGLLREIIDVAFPVLHGPFGEDGVVQGRLICEGVPFVGAGVLGSAVGMDKDVMKRLLRDAGIPQVKFHTLYRDEEWNLRLILQTMQFPLFVKPANLGSSVGITKVKNEDELESAIGHAFLFDRKVVVEEGVVARELEIGILGNERPMATLPGELIVHHDFYSYAAKREDKNGASFELPAKIDSDVASELQKIAVSAYKALDLAGMARIDFFLDKSGNIYLNEVNTIPGFTDESLYPKLWEMSGVSFKELIDSLIALALEDRESPNSRGALFNKAPTSAADRES